MVTVRLINGREAQMVPTQYQTCLENGFVQETIAWQ